MPRRKRVTGNELIRARKKLGFEVVRAQVAITACDIPIAGSRRSPSTPLKRLAPVCSAKSSATATSRTSSLKTCYDARSPMIFARLPCPALTCLS
jgi:hypothetical protein